MAYETIRYEKENGICVITFNRPNVLNAFSKQAVEELTQALDEITKDDEITVFILTGGPASDGRPCFSAGSDLKESIAGWPPRLTPLTAIQYFWTGENIGEIFLDIENCPKLSIAAVDGICTGGGLEIALSCDIILVSETALISDLHVKNLGTIGGGAAAQRLAWRVGVSKAIELCCTGDAIDGKEAHRIGLANQVFPPDKLLDGAKEMARKISAMRPAAVSLTKATCRVIYDMDYHSAWRYSEACLAILNSLDADAGGPDWRKERWRERERH
jgi:enoyl-CoA hydratase/carnithine racemase